jgi:hypothetical protein
MGDVIGLYGLSGVSQRNHENIEVATCKTYTMVVWIDVRQTRITSELYYRSGRLVIYTP